VSLFLNYPIPHLFVFPSFSLRALFFNLKVVPSLSRFTPTPAARKPHLLTFSLLLPLLVSVPCCSPRSHLFYRRLQAPNVFVQSVSTVLRTPCICVRNCFLPPDFSFLGCRAQGYLVTCVGDLVGVRSYPLPCPPAFCKPPPRSDPT